MGEIRIMYRTHLGALERLRPRLLVRVELLDVREELREVLVR